MFGPARLGRFIRIGLVLALFSMSATLPSTSAQTEPVFTGMVVQPLISPLPFAGADGCMHLAYELSVVNETSLLTRIDQVVALDADSGGVLGEWKGDALASVFRINGNEPGLTLARSHSGYLFLDATFAPGTPAPKAIRHRISITRLSQAPGGDEHKGQPLDPKLNLPATITFEAALTQVENRKVVVIAPPLRGPGWVAFNGCCDTVTSHRGAEMAFDGKPAIAQRFAIDLIQIDRSGRMLVGPPDRLASYPYFGAPVHAASDGVVVGMSDGAPEQVPQSPVVGVNVDNAEGNHVVIDMGNGVFALYAHMKTGSVRVKAGDRVTLGEVIGELGNSGNTDAPHLHFHVMDGPSPLRSSGLPYEIEAFQGAGRLVPTDDFFAKGAPSTIDRAWFPGPHRNELPLNNEVVDFLGD